MSEKNKELKEELRMVKLLYNIIKDKRVQKRFETTLTVNMETGEVSDKRMIDECEDYLIKKAKELVDEITDENQ